MVMLPVPMFTFSEKVIVILSVVAISEASSVGEMLEMVGAIESAVVKLQSVVVEMPAKLLLDVSSKAVASINI